MSKPSSEDLLMAEFSGALSVCDRSSFQFQIVALVLNACVETFVTDLEKAIWIAAEGEIAGVVVRSCAVHWGQAIWRKVLIRPKKFVFGASPTFLLRGSQNLFFNISFFFHFPFNKLYYSR